MNSVTIKMPFGSVHNPSNCTMLGWRRPLQCARPSVSRRKQSVNVLEGDHVPLDVLFHVVIIHVLQPLDRNVGPEVNTLIDLSKVSLADCLNYLDIFELNIPTAVVHHRFE